MVIFMILILFRFKKNMSSRTKNHRMMFFGPILITRFCAFLGIFANFRKIANHYFPNFYLNTNLMENQNMAYLIANLMRISKIAMEISIHVISFTLIQEDESNCMDPISGLLCAGHGQCVCGVGYLDLILKQK